MPVRLQIALITMPLVGACGDLSNDDLLFLAAIPNAHEVALEVRGEGTPGNALSTATLVGEPATLANTARHTASWVNSSVGRLLHFVGSLGHGHAPTTRHQNRRIWGPARDVGGEGITLRLEIERQWREDGAPRFVFCLHMGRDDDYTGGKVSCTVQPSAGLSPVLWGSYRPTSVAAGVRSGSGELRIDFDASSAAGATAGDRRGLFVLKYDFHGQARSIAIDWTEEGLSGDAASQAYLYEESPGGAVHFTLDATSNLVEGEAREELALYACWTADGPGVAEAVIRGGDVPTTTPSHARECWDARSLRTHYLLVVGSDHMAEGDLAACPDC